MNLIERARAALQAFTKGQTAVVPYAQGPYARVRVVNRVQGNDPRRGSNLLRNFSRTNEWVRLAVDFRKEQIAKASWKIVRLDDPKKPPSPAVEKAVRELFRYVNPRMDSFGTILDKALEDLLVLDAGCIEKERTLGGGIAALWDVDGSTIVPDPTWDGSDPKKPRYWQFIDGRPVMVNGEQLGLRNDQLIYMMRTHTSYSPIGFSPVEALIRTIEADLYGERYDFDQLKQTAPSGIVDLGRGVTPQQVDSFKELYESEIAGQQALMFFGGGEPGPGTGVKYQAFQLSNREQERALYKEWLVKKIAAVFRIDKSVFNITDQVNRATSKTQQQRTDDGLEALARDVAQFITREIIWEFDENHGFVFDNLSDRDQAAQAAIDTQYVGAGIWTINEIRARDGLDPVEWGDAPYVPTTGPVSPEVPDTVDPNVPAVMPQPPQDDDKPKDGKEGAKSAAPFGASLARIGSVRSGYLDISTH